MGTLLMVFLTATLLATPLLIIANEDKMRRHTVKLLTSVVSLFAAIMIIVVFATYSGYRYVLDNPNPFYKEYVYHQNPDGEMVKVDSIYVKTKKAR
jgi:formate hydrogenlyase subunit 3/multisubunit Na+/H+ antiporter MnhD subunit